MKTILSYTFFLLIFITNVKAFAQHKEINFEHGKWTEILAKAKKENKLIYLDCYTTWCGPCKWMAKNVFTNDTVAEFYNTQFVNAEMDMEKGEGLELAKRYAIRAYPTMLFLNGEGEVIHRGCGSSPAQSFIALGKDALDPAKQLMVNTQKFNNGDVDADFAFKYMKMLESGCQEYTSELSAYFASQKESDLSSAKNWKMINNYLTDYSSPAFNYLVKNVELFSKLYTSDSVQKKIIAVYNQGLYTAIYNKSHDADYLPLRKKVEESGSSDKEKILLDADLKYYQNRKNWKEYASAAVKGADKYMIDNAMALNSLAWNFYENIDDKSMLEKAEGWAKRSLEIQPMYANADTYASVLYKLGKKEEAKKAAKNAIEIAKKNGDTYSETEELLKKIEALNTDNTH
jgi:thioredoxin-related protein